VRENLVASREGEREGGERAVHGRDNTCFALSDEVVRSQLRFTLSLSLSLSLLPPPSPSYAMRSKRNCVSFAFADHHDVIWWSGNAKHTKILSVSRSTNSTKNLIGGCVLDPLGVFFLFSSIIQRASETAWCILELSRVRARILVVCSFARVRDRARFSIPLNSYDIIGMWEVNNSCSL